jgi:hypothetical protein
VSHPLPTHLTIVSRDELQMLHRQYLSPLDGIRDIAASMVRDWGYDPADHPGLLDVLEAGAWEAFSDTVHDIMRDRGLRGPADAVAAAAAGGEQRG